MSSKEAIVLEDPNGSKIMVTRFDDIAFAISVEVVDDQPFRLFEDTRAKLHSFLGTRLSS